MGCVLKHGGMGQRRWTWHNPNRKLRGSFPCVQTVALESGRNTIEQGRAIEIAGLLGLDIDAVGRAFFEAWQQQVQEQDDRDQ